MAGARGPGPGGDASPGPTVQLAHSFECIERDARLPWTVSPQRDGSATGAVRRYGVVVLPSPSVPVAEGGVDAERCSDSEDGARGGLTGASCPRTAASPRRLLPVYGGKPPADRGSGPAVGPPRGHGAARDRTPGVRLLARGGLAFDVRVRA